MSDAEICRHKNIGSSALYKRKKRWGISGMKVDHYGDSAEQIHENAAEPTIYPCEQKENSQKWQKRLVSRKCWRGSE